MFLVCMSTTVFWRIVRNVIVKHSNHLKRYSAKNAIYRLYLQLKTDRTEKQRCDLHFYQMKSYIAGKNITELWGVVIYMYIPKVAFLLKYVRYLTYLELGILLIYFSYTFWLFLIETIKLRTILRIK